MELIYAYAEKYRIFERKEFCFSNKFIVKYDRENNHLSLKRNPDYIDIYPENIVGISAIVGKNASGKTSLLDMIGSDNHDRASDEASYFLIYHYEKISEKDIFVFETNDTNSFSDLIEGVPEYDLIPHEDYQQVLHTWVFTNDKEICNSFIEDLLGKNGEEPKHHVQDECSIISFKSRINSADCDHEDIGEIPKRYSALENNSLCDIRSMLINRIKYCKKQVIYHSEYTPVIKYKSLNSLVHPLDTTIDSANRMGFDYLYVYLRNANRNLNWMIKNIQSEEYTLEDQIMLLEIDILRNIIFTSFGEIRGKKDREILLEVQEYIRLKNEDIINNTPEWISNLERKFAGIVRFVQQSKGYSHYIGDITVENIRDALYRMMEDADFNISVSMTGYVKAEIKLHKITEESDIHDNTLQEILNTLTKCPVIIRSVSTEIQFLSDGEKANLEMYSAIDRQIRLKEKKRFILLFDEIERCMHPEMCRTLISDLIQFLKGYPDKEFQIIIASHSSFIVGDLRKENLICLESERAEKKSLPESPFGQNIHTLLRSQFFLDNTLSEYAVQTINLIADCLTKESLADMRKLIWERLDPGEKYPWKLLPKDDQQTLQYLNSVISAIGEPMIRNSLQDELDGWKRTHLSRMIKQTELLRLQAQVAALQKELDEDG